MVGSTGLEPVTPPCEGDAYQLSLTAHAGEAFTRPALICQQKNALLKKKIRGFMPAIPFPLSRLLYIAPPTLMVRAGNESSRLSPAEQLPLQPAHPGWRERNQEIRPFRTFAFSKEPRYLQPLFSATVFSFGGCCMYREVTAVALFLLSPDRRFVDIRQAFAAGEAAASMRSNGSARSSTSSSGIT